MNVKSIASALCPSFFKSAFDRIETSPIGYRLATGTFWSMVGAVTSRGLMLASTILVARILGKTVYGELGMIQSTVGMFGIFAGFGLGLTATKHVAEFRQSDPERAGHIIGLSELFSIITGGVMAAGLFLFAPWLAEHTINAPHLIGVLRIGALIILINALNGAQTGALSGFEAFKTIAYVNLFVGLISFPILVCGAYCGGLTGAVWALVINLGINWFLNHIALRKETRRYGVPFTFNQCNRELSILWKFSLPAVLGGIVVSPVIWICNAILANRADGYAQLGIFSAANQWRIAILFIPGMLAQVVLPMLSNLNNQIDYAKYTKVLKYNILINGGTALLMAACVALLARLIMRSYGPGFEQGLWVLVCLAFTTVLVSVNNVVGQAIASKGHMWVGLSFNTLWAIVLLFATFILIPLGYGALGLAIANLIAYLFHCIWQGIYLKRVMSEN